MTEFLELQADREARRFIAQNETAAETLTAADVAPYAIHHAGGLVVLLGRETFAGLLVKMHDTWAGGASVVVHTYDPDDDDNEGTVAEFATGREALDHFISIIDNEEN